MAASRSKSAEIRARLNHPIIDSDGHTVEVGPLFFDYLKAVGGAKVADALSDRDARYLQRPAVANPHDG